MNKRHYPVPRPPTVNDLAPSLPSSSPLSSGPWLTTKAAAEYLGTTAGGIRNMVYRGQLIPYKPFGRLLFKRSDLDRRVESSRKGGVNGY